MIIIKLIGLWSFYILFLFYLLINVQNTGNGSSCREILVFLIAISLLLIYVRILNKENIFLKKSFFSLVLFFLYYLFKITFDIGDLIVIQSVFFSTSSGIVLFYCLGFFIFIVSTPLINITFSLRHFLILSISVLLLEVCCTGMLINIFFIFADNLRNDKLLLVEFGTAYQRTGNFLIISFLVISFVYSMMIVASKLLNNFQSYFFSFITLILYIIIAFLSMLLSQMVGSNNGFITIFGLFLITISFKIYIFLFKNMYFNEFKIKEKFFLFHSFFYFIYSLIATVILCFIVFMIVYDNIDISLFRISGFGSGEISSINSRIVLWNNFFSHLNDSPIFGNLLVEKISGDGTYIHSFIPYLITHLGFVGLVIFMFYIVSTLKEINIFNIKSPNIFYFKNTLSIYSTMVFICLFLIANIGTTIQWIPFWFFLGLFCPSISFKKVEY